MSDYDDRDSDIESDADKRAHHNALERKRRDHIKDSFAKLRDALPYFRNKKVRANLKQKASRAQILRKAIEYLDTCQKDEAQWKAVQDEYKKQVKLIDDTIRKVEACKSAENLNAAKVVIEQAEKAIEFINSYGDHQPEHVDSSDSDESSDNSHDSSGSPRKQLKAGSE